MVLTAGAQNDPAPLAASQGTFEAVTVTPSASLTAPSPNAEVSYLDYKNVYDAATLEEEVQLAAERFKLSKQQQETWMTAAVDRRQTEKQMYAQLNSPPANFSRDAAYRELRTAQNTFYERIVGYLSPSQKQAMEMDRAILQEKQNRIAKLPPPPPPPVTVAPVDTAAIILQAEKKKEAEKKAKRKKKAPSKGN